MAGINRLEIIRTDIYGGSYLKAIPMDRITPMKAIRKKCLDCSGYSKKYVKVCSALNCALWAFRLGISGYSKSNGKNPCFSLEFFEGLKGKSVDEAYKILQDRIKSKNE